jgi:protein gp37
MNKTNIEWCDSTWNPVTGCRHGCEYCYARRIAKRFGGYDLNGRITTHNPLPRAELSEPLTVTRANGKTINSPYPFGFEPTFHRYRLEEPEHIKKPQTIFVCSMADLFGPWVPTRWIVEVLDACWAAPQHRYLFLTKNPARYEELDRLALLPREENFWFGVTATDHQTMMYAMRCLPAWKYNIFISIEPMLGNIKLFEAEQVPSWIVLGAMTGPGSNRHQPKQEWVEALARDAADTAVPVFMKDSLGPIVGEENMLRELPWG